MAVSANVHSGIIQPSLVREIEDYETEEGPVSSIYLNVDVQFRGNPDSIRIALKDSLKEVEQLAERLDQSEYRRVRKDTEAVRAALSEVVLNPGMRSLACFVSADEDYFRLLPLPWSVRTRAFFEDRFVTWPLEEVLQQAERYGICLTDNDEARILVYYLDQIEEVSSVLDEVPGKIRYPDPLSELRYRRKHTEKVHEHLDHVAQRLLRQIKREPFDHLILGGPEEVIPGFEQHLHPYLAERVTARWHVPVQTNTEELRRMAREEEQRILTDQAESVWRQIQEQFPARASRGLGQVVESLWQSRVHSLLIEEGYSVPGKRWSSCHRLTTEGDVCPECGGAMIDVDDIVEEAALQAMAQAARIRHLRNHEGLSEAGSIASLNRF